MSTANCPFNRSTSFKLSSTSAINEPVDFVVDFAVEEPKRESATARAMRIWFKHASDE